jgi:glycosyltransferase involved in cell wall biosynthesis
MRSAGRDRRDASFTVAHLTTVDMSLRFLLFAQLRSVLDAGGRAIGISAPGPWVAELESAGIEHRALPSSTRAMNPRADLRAARELWQVLRSENVDILHTHNPKPGLYGRTVGRLAGVPIVVNTVHGLYATDVDSLAKRALVYGLEGAAAFFSDAELYQNPEDLDRMRTLHFAHHARLLGNGVDLERFNPDLFDARTRAAVRHGWRVTDETVVIGTVGRLVAEKGYPELFSAMDRLRHTDAVLVAVGGDDPEKPDALPHDVLDAARARGVRLLGHRDDVGRLYTGMDVFALASHREGYPRAAMEASAMGLPIVATDIRGCRQVVDQDVTGLLVPVADAETLASALSLLTTNAPLRRVMGTAARDRAQRFFDERRVVAMVMDTYREVAQRKGLERAGLTEPFC